MQNYLVILLSILIAVLVLSLLFFFCFFLFRYFRRKEEQKMPSRGQSRIHPKIPNPIYSISTNSIEKEINPNDTITTRKLSQMFDSKKRMSSAFSQRSSYFDYENSPQPKHKEYLDFADIENMLPANQRGTFSYTNVHSNIENPVDNRPSGRISVIEERPFSSYEAVREVFSEDHSSFRRDRPYSGGARR